MLEIQINLECGKCGNDLVGEYKPLFQVLKVEPCGYCTDIDREIFNEGYEAGYDDAKEDLKNE